MFEQHHIYIDQKLRELGVAERPNPSSGFDPISAIAQAIAGLGRFAMKWFGRMLVRIGEAILTTNQPQASENDHQPQAL